MPEQTTNIKLVKQEGNEFADNDIMNANLDTLDDEIGKRGKTVNGILPDSNGNYQVNEVPFARQIITDDLQQSSEEYIIRTTGGSVSISDGEAKLVSILGRSFHTGIVEESITMTVNAVAREEGEEITATLDRDTFVAYVSGSQTIMLEYTDAWSANPSLYGITVSGEPVEGDTIVIVYVEASRGVITNSTPGKFISTGWNLYSNSKGYARVLKYSDQYGFMVGGTYSTIKFSATLDGTKTTITPVDGKFTIPSDGYVWITGGNSTSTYVIMTWSDWTSGYSGTFQAYTESVINLATIMTNFPYGLLSVGGTADEIDLSTGVVTSRIERMAYSDANREAAIASGRAWDADDNYLYIVRETPVTYSTTISGDYSADDHGMEIVEGSAVPVFLQTLYGNNLVDKLRTDVVTKSQDLVNNADQTASGKALDARMGKTLNDKLFDARSYSDKGTISTLEDLENILNTELANMDNASKRMLFFMCGETFSCFATGVGYFVEMRKTSATNFCTVDIRGHGGVRYIVGGKTSSGWTFSRVESTGQNLAIVAYTDEAPKAIRKGQYVIWKGFIYKAKTDIANGATLSTSNLTSSFASGGLNDLFGPGQILASNTDLDTLTTANTYYLGVSRTYGHAPAPGYGVLEIIQGDTDGFLFQRVTTNQNIFIRYHDNSTWYDWLPVGLYMGTAASGALSTITSPGIYTLPAGSTYSDKPATDAYMMFVLKPSLTSSNYVQITFGQRTIYWRFISASGSAIGEWQEFSLGHNVVSSFSIASNTSKTITISDNGRAQITLTGASAGVCGTLIVSVTSAGAITTRLFGAESITITKTTNEFTIENSSSMACLAYVQAFKGTVAEKA